MLAGASLLLAAGVSFAQNGKTEVLWLGQAAMRITSPGGKVIMIDPWLTTNPKTPAQFKNLDALGKIDLILVTHAHVDHLGDAPALAKKWNVPIYSAAGMGNTLVTLGIVPAELAPRMGKSGTINPFPGIKITMVHAEHSSELVWKNPATGKEETHFGGEPVGFIIELENGFKIYHMGDTGLFGDMKLIGEYYKPDLIMIPIGGHFTMDPQDAAYATNEVAEAEIRDPDALRHQSVPEGHAQGIHRRARQHRYQGVPDQSRRQVGILDSREPENAYAGWFEARGARRGDLRRAARVAAFAAEIERSGGPYVPTPQVVVEQMLRMANVGPDDFVVDLGSGDGVIVLTAAQAVQGARHGRRHRSRAGQAEQRQGEEAWAIADRVRSTCRTCSRPISAAPRCSRSTCCRT